MNGLLTDYKKKVLKKIINGAILYTSEGEKYRCWLQYEDKGKIVKETVRKDTASILFGMGLLKEVNMHRIYYTYTYTEAAKKLLDKKS